MKKPIFLLFFLVSCSGVSHLISSKQTAGSDVIELESPIQDQLEKNIKRTQDLNAHTVYDSEKAISKFKKKEKKKILDAMSGPFKFIRVGKKDTNLKRVAQYLYKNPARWSDLQKWNFQTIHDENHIPSGTLIKYLPDVKEAKRNVASEKSSKEQFKYHIVGKGQSLGYIALLYLGSRKSWKQIYDWNRDILKNPEDLEIGMKVKYLPSRTPAGE